MQGENNTLLTHQSAKLVPSSSPIKDKGDTFLFLYDFEAPISAAQLGSMYIIIEMPANNSELHKLCDVITETIGHSYYNKQAPADLVAHFESALAATNRQIKSIDDRLITQFLSGMSAVIAIVTDRLVMSARSGNANALLLREQSLHYIFSAQHDKERISKIGFSDLASGSIKDGDKLALVSPAVMIALDKSALAASLNHPNATLIIHNLHKALISHSGQSNRHGALAVSITTRKATAEAPMPDKSAVVAVNPDVPLTKKVGSYALPLVQKSKKLAQNGYKKAATHIKQKLLPNLKRNLKRGWNGLWTRYINKNPRLAAAVAIGVTAVIIIIFSVVIRPHNNLDQEINAFKQLSSNYASAQAKLAEGDKTAATKKLDESQSQIDILKAIKDQAKLNVAIQKDKSISDKSTVADILSKVSVLSDKITATVRVNADVLATYSKNFVALSMTNQSLYALAEDNVLTTYDLSSKKTKTITTKIPAGNVIASAFDSTSNRIYYLTSEPSVWSFDIASASSSSLRLSSGDWPKADDISFYNGALYLLSNSAKQITKHLPTSIGFGPGTPYFKQLYTDSSPLHCLAINGNIFVSNESGSILLFNLGTKKDFTSEPLPSNIGYPVDMQLSAKSTSLSFLNNKHDRIFTMSYADDEASFAKQYAVTNLGSLSAFASADSTTNFYVVSQNKLAHFNSAN